MSESSNNSKGLIYEKIPKIMADAKAVGKDQTNQIQKFKYRGIEDVYNGIQDAMSKHGVFTTQKLIWEKVKEIKSQKGTAGIHVRSKYRFRFFAEDGSFVHTECIGEGLDYGDKASNKSLSVAHKYALTTTFCLKYADLDDPDAETPEERGPDKEFKSRQYTSQAPVETISDAQIKRLYTLASNHGWSQDEVKQIIGPLTGWGYDSTRKLKPNQYDWLTKKIEFSSFEELSVDLKARGKTK